MAPTSASPPEDGAKDNKIFGKHRWRGKIFHSEGIFGRTVEDQESNEEDLAHFLGNGTPRHVGRPQHAIPSPHIETQGASTHTQMAQDIAASPSTPENIYHRAKPKQNKGLHVGFVQAPPEIIGEGGDEAETPSILVSKQRSATSAWQASEPEPPQETSIDSTEVGTEEVSAEADTHSEDRKPQVSTKALEPQKILSHAPKEYANVRPVISNDRSGSLDEQFSPASHVLNTHKDGESDAGTTISDRLEDPSYLRSPSTFSTDVVGNSLTPRASPEPLSGKLDNTYFPQQHERSFKAGQNSPRRSREPSPQLPPYENPTNRTKSDTKPMSLRNIAKGLGLDALDEFEDRVRHFGELFRKGVLVHDDPTKISFKHWIRVATWWFLKGRGELESAVRNRHLSADNDHSGNQALTSSELKQAYVDLAKAWWITKEITPTHPEIMRYGNVSLSSMIAIIRNFGNKDLAECVQGHVNIVANLRALAMSMKRNQRLPPATLTIEELDVVVLLTNPDLPDDAVVAFLCPNDPERNLLDYALPLGDPEGQYTFCRIFGTGSVSSRTHSRAEVPFPCAMSLLRSKESLDLTALISTQEDSIGLTIRTDRSHDNHLTWKEVNWSTSGNFISVMIMRELTLSIQLSEQDFRSLWNIYDYTRKVQKDFQGRTGERLSFEAKTYDFQCLKSTRHASSFPLDPIRDCKVRLFARTETFSDGTGRMHAGYRLMVRTPPSVKSLSSISQNYGDDIPTIFGFSRREDRPRIAVSTPGSSAFVITFQSWEDVDLFYNIFTRRQPSSNEIRSASLTLNDLHISTEDHTLNKKAVHVPNVKWQQVRVISSETVDRSQSLRIIAQCDAGIMTDNLNLGKPKRQSFFGFS